MKDKWKNKQIIYIDLDDTLCDYREGIRQHREKFPELNFPQSQPGLYLSLEPLPHALKTYQWLQEQPEFETFILTAPSIKNPHSYSEKRVWVEQYLGIFAAERLIISAYKGLNRGDYLIDDYTEGKGQEYFQGELIQFGSYKFPSWLSVRIYFEEILKKIRSETI